MIFFYELMISWKNGEVLIIDNHKIREQQWNDKTSAPRIAQHKIQEYINTGCIKIKNKGTPAFFIGYSTDHGSNVYKMFNTQTKGISISRDVTWLNLTYGAWKERRTNPDKLNNDEGNLRPYHLRIQDSNEVIDQDQEVIHLDYDPEDILTERNPEINQEQGNIQLLRI